jgi:hypothetical protein
MPAIVLGSKKQAKSSEDSWRNSGATCDAEVNSVADAMFEALRIDQNLTHTIQYKIVFAYDSTLLYGKNRYFDRPRHLFWNSLFIDYYFRSYLTIIHAASYSRYENTKDTRTGAS